MVILVAFVAVGQVFGLPWSTDMFWQPSIKPYEVPNGYVKHIPYPPNSVSLDQSTIPMTRQSYEAITINPVRVNTATLEDGKVLFETYCYPCHGMGGLGDGPVIKKGFYPVDLTSPVTQAKTDGSIYAYIRMGGLVMMPRYDEFVSSDEAWKIVTYVRKLQEK